MICDEMGRELEVGRRIALNVGQVVVSGVIMEIEEGSVLANALAPGRMRVAVDWTMRWDPRQGSKLACLYLLPPDEQDADTSPATVLGKAVVQ